MSMMVFNAKKNERHHHALNMMVYGWRCLEVPREGRLRNLNSGNDRKEEDQERSEILPPHRDMGPTKEPVQRLRRVDADALVLQSLPE